MPYKPIAHGTIYNQKLARAASINNQIREIIAHLAEGGLDHARLYQSLTAITLLTVRSDDVITDLHQFDADQ
jgi:hypothetical protein